MAVSLLLHMNVSARTQRPCTVCFRSASQQCSHCLFPVHLPCVKALPVYLAKALTKSFSCDFPACISPRPPSDRYDRYARVISAQRRIQLYHKEPLSPTTSLRMRSTVLHPALSLPRTARKRLRNQSGAFHNYSFSLSTCRPCQRRQRELRVRAEEYPPPETRWSAPSQPRKQHSAAQSGSPWWGQ